MPVQSVEVSLQSMVELSLSGMVGSRGLPDFEAVLHEMTEGTTALHWGLTVGVLCGLRARVFIVGGWAGWCRTPMVWYGMVPTTSNIPACHIPCVVL